MDDGSLVEPDIYTPSQSDNDPMTSIQKPRPVQQASVSEEVEKPLTGIAAELDKRSEVASVAQSRQAQFDNIASIFGREEAAKMLNLPENIFS
jgi:ABC-type enterochelin transport system substrate-binding protein